MAENSNFLDALIYGYRLILDGNGAKTPKRRKLQLVGAELTDDEANDTTIVDLNPIPSAPGDDGDTFYNDGDLIAATGKIRRESDGEMAHYGTPLHREDGPTFRAPAARETAGSFAKPYWFDAQTDDDGEEVLGTISLPAATHGDCRISVVLEMGIAHASGGCHFSAIATFKRVSGTLTRISFDGTVVENTQEGTAVGGVDVAKLDNDTIEIRGTGIADTDVNWTPNAHVILTKKPT